MVKSDFELSQPFIAENSKQRINFECVTNVSLWERGFVVVVLVSSNKL